MKTSKRIPFILTLTLILASCATALYDQYSFTETLEVKAEAMSLINVSNTPYTAHTMEVEELKSHVLQMVAYEKARERNEISVKMWQYLASDAASLQKFIALWKEQSTMSPAFKDEYLPQIEHVFDLMADYESKKSKDAESSLLKLLTTQP